MAFGSSRSNLGLINQQNASNIVNRSNENEEDNEDYDEDDEDTITFNLNEEEKQISRNFLINTIKNFCIISIVMLIVFLYLKIKLKYQYFFLMLGSFIALLILINLIQIMKKKIYEKYAKIKKNLIDSYFIFKVMNPQILSI